MKKKGGTKRVPEKQNQGAEERKRSHAMLLLLYPKQCFGKVIQTCKETGQMQSRF